MIPSIEREKLAKAGRKREQCWRKLQSSIVAYAEAVAPKDVSFQTSFGVKLAGNKHVPRVLLNRESCFEKLLPYLMITSGGKRRPFTSAEVYQHFQMAMFAAGIDIKSHYSPVVSIREATQAIALFRLTGKPYEAPSWSNEIKLRADRVKRILRDREAKWKRINKAEMEEYRALKASTLDPRPSPQ